MVLISKSGDAQPVGLRTLDNALPIDAHRDIGFSDCIERRMQVSMSGTDLNASLKILVGAAVIDCNHVATLQVRCDSVHPIERGLIKNRVINRPFDENNLIAVESDHSLRPITDQA